MFSQEITGAGQYNVGDQSQQVEREDAELDRDAFLKLLTTQLSYQDPMEPMDNTEFVSQMAQFSSLEQMENMNTSMDQFLGMQSLTEGASLIGKTVETIDQSSGQKFLGEVNQISREDGEIYLHISGREGKYPMGAVNSIYG